MARFHLFKNTKQTENIGNRGNAVNKIPMPYMPTIWGILIILFLVVFVIRLKMPPEYSLRDISRPYRLVEVVSTQKYILEDEKGKIKEVEVENVPYTTFINRPLTVLLEDRNLYYRNGIIYYINDAGSIETVNYYITQNFND